MRRESWSTDPCPIARTMSVLGQPWTTLILREALLGRQRFSEFRETLGVSSDVLSARLRELIAVDVLRQVDYQEPGDRTRSAYELTDAGRGLVAVLAAMGQWGRRHLPRADSSDYRFLEAATGEPVVAGFHRPDGRAISTEQVVLAPTRAMT
jgi:DNA-binding HxlR family transcriptional regulator